MCVQCLNEDEKNATGALPAATGAPPLSFQTANWKSDGRAADGNGKGFDGVFRA